MKTKREQENTTQPRSVEVDERRVPIRVSFAQKTERDSSVFRLLWE